MTIPKNDWIAALKEAQIGCRAVLNEGVSSVTAVYIGGMTNMLITLSKQGHGKETIDDVILGLVEFVTDMAVDMLGKK